MTRLLRFYHPHRPPAPPPSPGPTARRLRSLQLFQWPLAVTAPNLRRYIPAVLQMPLDGLVAIQGHFSPKIFTFSPNKRAPFGSLAAWQFGEKLFGEKQKISRAASNAAV